MSRALALLILLTAAPAAAAEPVVIELGYGQIARSIHATMRKLWYPEGCSRVLPDEVSASAFYRDNCLGREIEYRNRTMHCPYLTAGGDDCWNVSDWTRVNRELVARCNAELERLEHLYRCGELPAGEVTWKEHRTSHQHLRNVRFRRERVACTSSYGAPCRPVPIAPGTCQTQPDGPGGARICYRDYADVTEQRERKWVRYKAAGDPADEKLLHLERARGGTFRFLAKRRDGQFGSKLPTYNLDLRNASFSGVRLEDTFQEFRHSHKSAPQVWTMMFLDDRDWPATPASAADNWRFGITNWNQKLNLARGWRKSEYFEVCVVSPGMEVRVPRTSLDVTGIDSVTLGWTRIKDVRICALAKLMYAWTPGTIGRMGPVVQIIDIYEPRFHLTRGGFEVDLETWADILTGGLGGLIANMLANMLLALHVRGDSISSIVENLGSTSQAKAAGAQLTAAWGRIESEMMSAISEAASTIRDRIDDGQQVLIDSCQDALHARAYNWAYGDRLSPTKGSRAGSRLVAQNAVAACQAVVTDTLVKPGMRDPYIDQRCYGSRYRARQIIRSSESDENLTSLSWWQQYAITPEHRNLGCRMRFELDFPGDAASNRMNAYLACAARYASLGINVIPWNYDDALADPRPWIVTSAPARQAVMDLIKANCPLP
jgi:hypothetical protein